ncbi:MAG: hypothetical protein COA84_14490 [Robiginitomaculum sp.]|nr:MAG: hypothetical protein COA84_14490 [Robiginitomaculum sp.]
MTLAFGFEILLAVLLLVTVFYCWRLDTRLNALRTGQDGMRDAVTELIKATTHAEACIAGLRQSATQSGSALDERIKNAQKIAADLQRLTRQSAINSPAPSLTPVSTTHNAPQTHPQGGLLDRLRKAG